MARDEIFQCWDRDFRMLYLRVDFNEYDPALDVATAWVPIEDAWNPPALEQKFEVGLRVVVYDSGDRYEGVLRKSEFLEGWVAELIQGTGKELQPGEYERLEALTRRAALRVT